MGKCLLEVCVDSVESAIAACEGGADRLELCANLIIGGTTPSLPLLREVRKQCDVEIRCLIRPRFGDFLYSDFEYAQMYQEIELLAAEGADGFVIGALDKNGNLDLEKMQGLMKAAGGKGITLHRAFDVCADPFGTLEKAVELGIDTILTSGQEMNCELGAECIKRLIEQSRGRIEIMAGAGVSSDIIASVFQKTGAVLFHMSGKRVEESGMLYRKEHVPMGFPGFHEFQVWKTDKEEIKKAKEILINNVNTLQK